MNISRRDFLRYCGISAATLGLTGTDLFQLEEVLANPASPSVIWLQGAGCTGCSISLLNRISTAAPQAVDGLLVNTINLVYHPNLMAVAGEDAVSALTSAAVPKRYILAVEGGIPTAFGGHACVAWSKDGVEKTFRDAVVSLASNAKALLAVGTCAAWGGIPASGSNPTGVQGLSKVAGRRAINIAGCPTHPDWVVWVISRLLLKKSIKLDASGRPKALFSKTVHEQCPRRERDETETFGVAGRCLEELGCRGPRTKSTCPVTQWNGGTNWCIGANAPCIGCTTPGFPGAGAFYHEEDGDGHDD